MLSQFEACGTSVYPTHSKLVRPVQLTGGVPKRLDNLVNTINPWVSKILRLRPYNRCVTEADRQQSKGRVADSRCCSYKEQDLLGAIQVAFRGEQVAYRSILTICRVPDDG